MATSRIESSTALVSSAAILYIRQITLKVSASLLKPNTKMYAFFDGVDVNHLFTQTGKAKGAQLITDGFGRLTGTLDIPGFTFTTGSKELVIVDNSNYSPNIAGIALIKATGIFSSAGTLQTYQTTQTTVNTTVVEVPVVQRQNFDPLAQSFFTYGVTGGCYLTSIDLYFNTKDDTLPIWVEVREMANGYPSPVFVSPHATSILNPTDVNLSNNGSVSTRFIFSELLYLKQDKDYCFVVRSNSSKYNLWTSRMSEKSNETNNIVFDQPYMGSLFKSENNITWSAEQMEDIKFVLNRANFDTSKVSGINLALTPNAVSISSSAFQTIASTSKIFVTLPFKHGFQLDDLFTCSVDPTGTYNGISGVKLTGSFPVTNIISDYSFGYLLPSGTATSTGPIYDGGLIKDILVTAQGSGYTDSTEITILGSVGSGATATPVIKNGKLTNIVITNYGSGYNGNVVVNIVDTVGVGAIATAYTSSKFTINTNRVYHSVTPSFDFKVPNGVNITTTLETTSSYYTDGNLPNYGGGKTYGIDINGINNFDSNLLLASVQNEQAKLGTGRSAKMTMQLSTTNSNVSPVLNLANSSIMFRTNSINNQKDENVASTNSSGSVLLGSAGVLIVNPGAGYSTAPDVVITGTGTGAVATCTINGSGVITAINVTDGGTGYYGDAKVIFSGGGTPTTVATGIVVLTDYNSELKSGFGNSLTRYITKKQTLETVSYKGKVYVTAFSNSDSSFEVYIKKSLSSSSDNHDSKEWELLYCPITRNKSQNSSQFLEYEFDISGQNFDVYSLKFVLRTKTPWQPPIINNYRAIILS